MLASIIGTEEDAKGAMLLLKVPVATGPPGKDFLAMRTVEVISMESGSSILDEVSSGRTIRRGLTCGVSSLPCWRWLA